MLEQQVVSHLDLFSFFLPLSYKLISEPRMFPFISVPPRYQHEESLQELHHSGSAGGVQEQRAQSCTRDVQY